MKIEDLKCKVLGHEKNFVYKSEDQYYYVCARCGQNVQEDIKYKKTANRDYGKKEEVI